MSPLRIVCSGLRITTLLLLLLSPSVSASIRECRQLFLTGEYAECLQLADEAIERRAYGEDWPILKLRSQRELGRCQQALTTATQGIQRYPWSIRLHYEAYLSLRQLGQAELARETLREINRLAGATPWRYSDADDLVTLGQAALAVGADPKDVLQGFFERARRNFGGRPDGVLASAELAIEKGDFAYAAELLEPARDAFPENPYVLWAHSRAIRGSDAKAAEAARLSALQINPHFKPALLAEANRLIDREQFGEAEEVIAEIRQDDPFHPEACGLLAAVHLLRNDVTGAQESRAAGLLQNPLSPWPDHITGATLSRRYRFAEGAALQRQSLQLRPGWLPARTQLAQDLLRLGDRDEGWMLAENAHQQDGYDTQLFNLLQLHDSLNRFEVLRSERFEVSLPQTEARVFGDHVLRLLDQAWDELTQRYGYEPQETVLVEIFDRPDDFAVRTFGLPDVAGFLGVCFGRVITANSPTSQRANPTNWESVLWHEFCHVITLQMTGNRIPRWLSEGISVYEERRRDPRCGQKMSPAFRDRILKGAVTPVSRLSSAFLEATSGEDMNFAYYQSSMVVEFFVEQWGHESLVAVLHDLNRGLQINDALERNSTELASLDTEFRQWLLARAEAFAPGVVFDAELLSGVTDLMEFCRAHPEHYPAGLALARRLAEQSPKAAEEELQRLMQLYPQESGRGGARRLLAALYRRQGRETEEFEVLKDYLAFNVDDAQAAQRLVELSVQKQDWTQALAAGRLVLAVDPAQLTVLRQLAEASEQAADSDMALHCLKALLELDASQSPGIRLRLAQQLQTDEPREARRQLLLALEQAPRFRQAHQLLLQFADRAAETESSAGDTVSPKDADE